MAYVIENINDGLTYDAESIEVDPYWNRGDVKEKKMHNVHAYPAKFPAFIASKAIDYAKRKSDNQINLIADIFCGCGTVALEAKNNGLNFWGCDINPVATLIAEVKSNTYSEKILDEYYQKIIGNFERRVESNSISYKNANRRIAYWHTEKNYNDLLKLKNAIEDSTGENIQYKKVYLCIFSSILKPTSKWLMKSIKPQVDPHKKEQDVLKNFKIQYNKFLKAVIEINENCIKHNNLDIRILNKNFLADIEISKKIDLIITSPPYATSYEYADLHQLTALWLFVDDYKELRTGTIGSVHNSQNYEINIEELNEIGKSIVHQLNENKQIPTSKTKSVARYYIDIQKAIKKCNEMLTENGMAIFVVGDTEYKNVKIENSKHLVYSLMESNFEKVEISRRKISNKILTPYRTEDGKFSSDNTSRKIYHEEFVIIAWRKKNDV